jgi:phosphosulfolactate synthase
MTGQVSRLEDRAFAALRIPARSAKPRDHGLTIVADRGIGTRGQADLLEVGADFVDWVKICSASPRLYTPQLMRRKIGDYAAADVRVFVAGDGFELGIAQGVMRELYAEAAALGCAGVEVASAQVVLALEEKVRLVNLATEQGLLAFAEVGKKGQADHRAHSGWMLKQVETLLDAGAYRVLVQGEGINEDVNEIDETLLLDLVARFGPKVLIFQAKDERARRWFIEHLGPDTNLDIEARDLVPLELARRGLAKRGLTGLVAGSAEGLG